MKFLLINKLNNIKFNKVKIQIYSKVVEICFQKIKLFRISNSHYLIIKNQKRKKKESLELEDK